MQACTSPSQAGTTCPCLLHSHVHRHWVLAASQTQKYSCFLRAPLKATLTGLGHALFEISERSHFLHVFVYVSHTHTRLAISMQQLEYIWATTTSHPYTSNPAVVFFLPPLPCFSFYLHYILSVDITPIFEVALTLPTNFAWVYAQKCTHNTHANCPKIHSPGTCTQPHTHPDACVGASVKRNQFSGGFLSCLSPLSLIKQEKSVSHLICQSKDRH